MKLQRKYYLNNLSKYRGELYGFSILWIVFYHAFLIQYDWSGVFSVFSVGYLGVEIFLFLSGISLYFSMAADHKLYHFYIKRIIRLLIPMFTILTPYYIHLLNQESISPVSFLIKLFLRLSTLQFWIDGSQQTWFVSMILIAYALYPLIFRIITHKNNIKNHILTATFLCLSEYCLCAFAYIWLPEVWLNNKVALLRFPIFTLGCFFGPYVYKRMQVSLLFVPCNFFISILSIYIITRSTLPNSFKLTIRTIVGVSISICLSYIFQITTSHGLGFINKAFRFLGSITLEMYLFHIMAINIYKKSTYYEMGNLPRYVVLMLFCFFVSFLYSLVDKWLIKRLNGKLLKAK